MQTLLPIAYLPSLSYMVRLLQGPCTIDLHEHFVKRSERNRARILTANGVMELTAHVQHGNRPRTPICDLRLDYSKRWQHQHATALRSAYKSSPCFDFYWDALAPFYEREWKFLVDYNLELLALLLDLLGHPERMPRLSSAYLVAEAGDLDLRPKKSEGPIFEIEPYVQVFSDRMPFVPNLSILDLLCAEGPAAAALLARCRI